MATEVHSPITEVRDVDLFGGCGSPSGYLLDPIRGLPTTAAQQAVKECDVRFGAVHHRNVQRSGLNSDRARRRFIGWTFSFDNSKSDCRLRRFKQREIVTIKTDGIMRG